MTLSKRLVALGTALALAVATTLLLALGAMPANAATGTLCTEQTAAAGGGYIVQNNEFGSGAAECVTADGAAAFTVGRSAIANATNGEPGAYPSIYQGCHWGDCSAGGLSAAPVRVSALAPGTVTTSWSTAQPGGGGNAYDVAYDIWVNRTPTASGQPDGTELMVWLNHNGSVRPFGAEVARDVAIGGRTYNIWEGAQSGWDTVTYDLTTPAASVSGLDVGQLADDSVNRGYTQSSWYLIDVEAGFELWRGGAGLATKSFSVDVNGASPAATATTPTLSPSPSTSITTPAAPAVSPTPITPSQTPTGARAGDCSASYSLVNRWPGGFQAQVVVTNTGSGTLSGWTASWAFPGRQQINDLWNASRTQSGRAVTVTPESYNRSIPPGGTATIGFTGSYAGDDASPASVSCR